MIALVIFHVDNENCLIEQNDVTDKRLFHGHQRTDGFEQRPGARDNAHEIHPFASSLASYPG